MGIKMYQNYIFDLYGTLLDIHTDEGQESLWEELTRLYQEEGALYTRQELKKAYEMACKEIEERMKQQGEVDYPEIEIGEVFAGLFTEKGVAASKELVADIAYRFRVLSRDMMKLYAETESLLQGLRKKGKGVYLLSNAQRLFTAPEIKEAGLEKYFDDIFISSDYGVKKPDKAYMEKLLKKHGLKLEECLMIGNEPQSDIAVAEKCGMDSLLVTDGDFSRLKQIAQLV